MRLSYKKIFALLKNEKAFTLPEVMITSALGSSVVIGLGMLFMDISKMQSQVRVQASMAQVSAQLRAALSDTKAWKNTVNLSLGGSANLQFLCAAQNTAGCTPTTPSSDPLNYPSFNSIMDAANNFLYTDNGTNGYSYGGSPCTSFSSGAGTDACPFSYRLRLQYACPASTSCLNPQVTVWGVLQYSPSSSGLKLTNLNLDKFQIRVVKGMNTARNDIIQVVEQVAGNGGPISNGPSFQCSTTGITRTFNTTLVDSACNGIAAGATCNVTSTSPLTLVGGTYVCYASAEGSGVNGFSLSMEKDGVPIPGVRSPIAFAAATGVETATISNFTVTSSAPTFTLALVQRCQQPGSAPYALGFPLGISGVYTNNIYSGIYCTRIL